MAEIQGDCIRLFSFSRFARDILEHASHPPAPNGSKCFVKKQQQGIWSENFSKGNAAGIQIQFSQFSF